MNCTVSPDGKKLTLELDLDPDNFKVSSSGRTWLVAGGAPLKTSAKVDIQGKKREVTLQITGYVPRLPEDKVPEGTTALPVKEKKGKDAAPSNGGEKSASGKKTPAAAAK